MSGHWSAALSMLATARHAYLRTSAGDGSARSRTFGRSASWGGGAKAARAKALAVVGGSAQSASAAAQVLTKSASPRDTFHGCGRDRLKAVSSWSQAHSRLCTDELPQ